eukprot:Opistho-1_new@109385
MADHHDDHDDVAWGKKPLAQGKSDIVPVAQSLMDRINKRDLTVGVIGLGYVGLPLACAFAEAGFNTIGFDVIPAKVERLNKGTSDVGDISSEELARIIKERKIAFTTDFARLAEVDAVSICVPTPLSKHRVPDLSFILSAMDPIEKHMRKNTLIVLESTTYPGSTREMVAERMSKKGFKVGHDLFVCFSPERIDPSNKQYNLQNTPKVIGGMTWSCMEVGKCLYEKIVVRVVPVNSAEEAEMVKLLENTFRAVNIALINEMAQMCDRMNVNIWNVVNAAKTKPFGFMPFFPGPGIGGHCIPLDPMYLSYTAKVYSHYNRFIELASDINENMPYFAVAKIGNILNEIGRPFKGAKVLLIGLAYKKNVSDKRESASLYVWRLLAKAGCEISYHDSYCPTHNERGTIHHSVPFTAEELRKYDLVAIVTDHDDVDYRLLLKEAKCIFDSRNAIGGRGIFGLGEVPAHVHLL